MASYECLPFSIKHMRNENVRINPNPEIVDHTVSNHMDSTEISQRVLGGDRDVRLLKQLNKSLLP